MATCHYLNQCWQIPFDAIRDGITRQGLPFSKSSLAQLQEFWNSSICLYEIKRKNFFKSTCPTGRFTCPGPSGSGKRRALLGHSEWHTQLFTKVWNIEYCWYVFIWNNQSTDLFFVPQDCPHVSRTKEEFYTVRCQVADMKNLNVSTGVAWVKSTVCYEISTKV